MKQRNEVLTQFSAAIKNNSCICIQIPFQLSIIIREQINSKNKTESTIVEITNVRSSTIIMRARMRMYAKFPEKLIRAGLFYSQML